jgi:hypothetical protein
VRKEGPVGVDPVCQKPVDEKGAPGGKAEYKGQTYSFIWPLGAIAALLLLTSGCGPRGAHFTLPGPREMWHIHGLALDPSAASVLWVATHTGLVRWQENKGWEVAGRPDDYMGFAVSVSPQGGRLLYRSGHPGPGTQKPNPLGLEVSRDGWNWETISGAGRYDFHALAVSPADPQIIYGYNVFGAAGLYRSQDGGRSWAFLGRPEAWVYALAAHPREPMTLLAVTEHGLLVSRRGGEKGSWEPLMPGSPVTAVAYHPSDPHRVLAFAVGDGLMESRDGGRSWERLGLALGPREVVLYIAPDPSSRRLFVATSAASVYMSADGGRTWKAMLKEGKEVRAP